MGLVRAQAGAGTNLWTPPRCARGRRHPRGSLLISWLAPINVSLLVFNLIPAFPLDGGRIARAIAWHVTGDRPRATRFAATLGQVFAYVLIGLGHLHGHAHRRRPSAGSGCRARVVPAVQAARGTVAPDGLPGPIEGVTVRHHGRRAGDVPASVTATQAPDEYFLCYRRAELLITAPGPHAMTAASQPAARAAARRPRRRRPLRPAMVPAARRWPRAPPTPKAPSWAAARLPLRRFGPLTAWPPRAGCARDLE